MTDRPFTIPHDVYWRLREVSGSSPASQEVTFSPYGMEELRKAIQAVIDTAEVRRPWWRRWGKP